MEEQELYESARKQAEARLGFYIHLAVYVLVNALLVAINLTTSPDALWFYWPLGGWGIGVVFHALAVFVLSGRPSLKERMVERIVAKERKKAESRQP
jgi:hypothetical protein